MYSLIILFALMVGPESTVDLHEFHLSKTTINYDTEETAVQISTRIFIDDLESSLKDLGHDSLKICSKKEKLDAEAHIYDYLKNNLVIVVDGLEIEYEFLGKEQSDDLSAVWCYLEAYDINSFRNVDITNTILIKQFDDQKNITMVQKDKVRVAHLLFTADNTYETVEQ